MCLYVFLGSGLPGQVEEWAKALHSSEESPDPALGTKMRRKQSYQNHTF